MTNIEKAVALVTCFTNGDKETASSLLKENYIQHNLAYGTGRDAFLGSVEYLGSAPVKTTFKNIRAFEDGDKVVLQSVYNFAGMGDQVAFDVFRFEDGLIAEHWDNLANIAPANPSGHTQIDGDTNITPNENTEKTRKNKEKQGKTCIFLLQKKCRFYATLYIVVNTTIKKRDVHVSGLCC